MSNSRKYERYFKPISHEQFSTSGTMRTQGRIGQTSLSRSITRTPFKGQEPVGYGSSNNTYIKNIVFSCNNSSLSNGQSTLTNKGHILSKIVNPTSVYNDKCSFNKCDSTQIVKNFNSHDHLQSSYVRKLKGINVKKETTTSNKDFTFDCDNIYMLGTRKISRNSYHKVAGNGAITSGEYNETVLLKNNCLPTPPCKQPFPLTTNKNGCNIEYKTPDEAITAGILPLDWMSCSNKYPEY